MNSYHNWLRAAYRYYITPGEDTGMTDSTWDNYSLAFYKERSFYAPELFPILHHPEFTGGSLFWLKSDEYPEEVKK